MEQLRTDGKDCFLEVPCTDCGEPVLIIFPNTFNTEMGEWPEVKATCPECRPYINFTDIGIPHNEINKYIPDERGPGRFMRYNFETKEYEPGGYW